MEEEGDLYENFFLVEDLEVLTRRFIILSSSFPLPLGSF